MDRKCSWSSPPSTLGERPVKQLQRLSKFAQYFSEKRGNLPAEKSTFFIPGEPEYYKHLRLFWNTIKFFFYLKKNIFFNILFPFDFLFINLEII